MGRRLAFALAPFLILALCLPAWALTPGEVQAMQEDELDLDGLEREAAAQGGTAEYGTSLDEGLSDLIDTGTRELSSIIRRAVRSGVLILLIVLFCGLADTVQEGMGKGRSRAAVLAGTLAVTAVAVADVNSLMGMGTGAISNMASFANVLLPTVAALTAAMELMDKLVEAGGLSGQVVEPVIKTAGIAIVTRLAADFCREAQEGGLASAVELAGTALALVTVLPLMSAVLDMLTGLI